MQSKLHAAIGLCARAKKLAWGDAAVDAAIKKGQALLVLIDESASDNTKEKILKHCDASFVQGKIVQGVAKASGRPDNKAFAVLDEGFCRMIEGALILE